MSDHAIPTLLRKRAEIAGLIDTRQAELVNMLSDLNALDCAIRIFDPEIELPEIVMRPLPVRDHAGRGQMATTVLAILREQSAPMQTEAIRDEVMRRRGLSLADRPLARMMLGRVHGCLRGQRGRKVVTSQKMGKFSGWEVVR
jgi:hypothetical protein